MKWTPTLVMTILLGQDQDRGRGRGSRDEDSGLYSEFLWLPLAVVMCAMSLLA